MDCVIWIATNKLKDSVPDEWSGSLPKVPDSDVVADFLSHLAGQFLNVNREVVKV